MKVYIVCWTDSASDGAGYYIEKAFSTEEKAKEFISELNLYPSGNYCEGIYGEPWIEEVEVN